MHSVQPIRSLKFLHRDDYVRKGALRNFTKFTGKHLCQNLFFNKVKKETLAQVFSCEFCEISNNTFHHRTPLMAASIYHTRISLIFCINIFWNTNGELQFSKLKLLHHTYNDFPNILPSNKIIKKNKINKTLNWNFRKK